jgi:dTDP-4-dehydrorhamnose 3,5-epimerase
MIKGVKIKKLEKIFDQRGWLTEIFRADQDGLMPAMSYVSQTLPGVVRGPHEHVKQSDFFIFLIGEFELYLWDNRLGAKNYRQKETIKIGGANPGSVIVPPGVVHAYKCVSAEPGLIINLPDQLYKGKNKAEEVDEIRWEARADSPFIID